MTDGPDDDVKDVPEPEQQEEPAKPAYDPEVAEEARLWGWKPADEWVGDRKEGFIEDPNRYLDRLKSSRLFKTFEERLSEKEREIEERARRLDGVYQKTIERQRNEFKANLDRIAAGQRKAVEVADVAAYEQLEREKRSLVPPPSNDIPPPSQPQEPPELVRARERFINEREWAKDPALRFEGAQAIDVAMKSGQHFATYEDQLQYADGVMRKRYPHLFQQSAPVQQRASRVDGGGLAGGSVSAATKFDKLPPEAKTAFRKFVAQGLFDDSPAGRKQYAEDYPDA